MEIIDSQQGLITATTGSTTSRLEYYVVGVQGTIAGEWVVHGIHSNLAGHGGAMMYHLCMLAAKNGIRKLHATSVAVEAYDRYRTWGFSPDPKGIEAWTKLGITDPNVIKVADWYADVATVKMRTMASLYTHWMIADNAVFISAAQQILATLPPSPPMPQVQTLDDIIANGGKL